MSGQGKHNPTVGERWENGMPHDPRSVAIFKGIARVDAEQCSNSFDWRYGGDGDNGEELMFALDVHFADADAQTEADDAHAAGYDEAVADIRQHLQDAVDTASPMTVGADIESQVAQVAVEALKGAIEQLDIGAHVGTAKRSGT